MAVLEHSSINAVFHLDISGTLTFCAVAHNMLGLFCLSSCTVKSSRLDSLFLDGAEEAGVGEGWAEVTMTESLV